MKLFKKKSKTLDFTKVPNETRVPLRNYQVDKHGMVDLRNETLHENKQNISSQPVEKSGGIFDFLTGSSKSSSSNLENPVTQVSELSELKVKMRDFTNKMENLDNELYRLLHKIELLEQKLSRYENR